MTGELTVGAMKFVDLGVSIDTLAKMDDWTRHLIGKSIAECTQADIQRASELQATLLHLVDETQSALTRMLQECNDCRWCNLHIPRDASGSPMPSKAYVLHYDGPGCALYRPG